MKKAAITVVIAVLSLVLLVQSGVLDALAAFLLAGVIPGTKYAVPSSFMLLIIMSAAWLLVLRLANFDALQSTPAKSSKKTPAAKKRLPRQRYKQV